MSPCNSTDAEVRKRHDTDIVISLFQTIVKGASTEVPMIKTCYRLKQKARTDPTEGEGEKQNPVLKVTFVKTNELRAFVQNSRLIKDNKALSKELQQVMISRDLTFKQREVNRKLRNELEAKNKDDPGKYTIRNGKVVPKSNSASGTGASGSPSD